MGITLTNLATLGGTISGGTFSGSGNAIIDGEDDDGVTKIFDSDLSHAGGAFTGTVEGAFYGPAGAEAGGVFDYNSLRSMGGAFRGAFGVAKDIDTHID